MSNRSHMALLPPIGSRVEVNDPCTRPVARHCTLRCPKRHLTQADPLVQNILQRVLLACRPPVCRMQRLGPQVPIICGRSPQLKRDQMVFLVIAHVLIGASENSQLPPLQRRREPARRPDRARPPGLQIVWPMVSCVTAGLTAPGVRTASGSELCAKTGVDSVRSKAAQERAGRPITRLASALARWASICPLATAAFSSPRSRSAAAAPRGGLP